MSHVMLELELKRIISYIFQSILTERLLHNLAGDFLVRGFQKR